MAWDRGRGAKNSSSTVIKMLKRLLTTGFDKDVSIDLINSAITLNSEEETYATIDIAILDLISGNIEFVKNGACPTFIKRHNNVDIVKTVNLPAGMLDKIDLVVYDKDLVGDEIIVMCSDGITESNKDLLNKELWVKEALGKSDLERPHDIANMLLEEAVENGDGIVQDDMTVIVIKVNKI